MKHFLFIVCLLPALAWSQQWTKNFDYVDDISCGLSLVGKDGKRGYVNHKGQVVIPLVYEEAMHFSEGLAAMAGDLLQIVFILGFMFYEDWRLALLSRSTIPLKSNAPSSSRYA